ncbi:TrmH family RNA methyltransferase [Flammeovirga pectinis]|uniref:tRNA (guanosine(18)-2'-O)-methyltransferase n=1 Tax=Flammeovirga pectinis TaxID=2494373 RepID=A0A3Q9FQF3_9BACT|nr:RNA methyltransferase [Flammeovirga pectinis]AZQ63604.1 TrmH family RNA methyltransferase [Flammeovirga pectinis]
MPYAKDDDFRFFHSDYFKKFIEEPGLIEYLKDFISEQKREGIEEVLSQRTNHLTVLLEEIYKPQNVGAIIRTCDCFGLQNLHIVEAIYKFLVSIRTTQGSAKWVDVNKYKSTIEAAKTLKGKGYKLVATTPHTDMSIDDLPTDAPIALMFGNEKEGLSDEAMELADYKVKIPMYGFAESFNISVSVALCLNQLSAKIRKDESLDLKLSDEEYKNIGGAWVCKSIDRFETVTKSFRNKKSK